MTEVKNPNLACCFSCGKQYGHRSIRIHERQCREKLEENNTCKTSVLRLRRSTQAIRKSNDSVVAPPKPIGKAYPAAGWSIQGLKNPSNRLARSSKPVVHKSPFDNDTQTRDQEPLGRVRISYINGREFGTDTYVINRPPPGSAVVEQNNQEPAFDMYAMLESLPAMAMEKLGRPRLLEEDLNEMAYQQFKKSLHPCPGCGRTFLLDRLPAHRRHCKK